MIPKIRKRPSGAYSVWFGKDVEEVFANAQVAIDFVLNHSIEDPVQIEMYCGKPEADLDYELRSAVKLLRGLLSNLHAPSGPGYHLTKMQLGLDHRLGPEFLRELNLCLQEEGYALSVRVGDSMNTFYLERNAG
jgi:predicted RNase H-like HicB family nuclease